MSTCILIKNIPPIFCGGNASSRNGSHLEGQFVLFVVLEGPHLVHDVLEVRLDEVDGRLELLPDQFYKTVIFGQLKRAGANPIQLFTAVMYSFS